MLVSYEEALWLMTTLSPARREPDEESVETGDERVHATSDHSLVADVLELLEVCALVAEFSVAVAETAVLTGLGNPRVFGERHETARAFL